MCVCFVPVSVRAYEEVAVVPLACFLISVTILPSVDFLPWTERCLCDKHIHIILTPSFCMHSQLLLCHTCVRTHTHTLTAPVGFDAFLDTNLSSDRSSHPASRSKHGRPGVSAFIPSQVQEYWEGLG